MTKLGTVELREREYILCSYSQAPSGIWEMNGHFRRISVDLAAKDAAVLGDAMTALLDLSNSGAPMQPTDDPFAPVLDALGLRSYAEYMKGAVSVKVRLNDDHVLKITPTRNGGARKGFEHLPEKARTTKVGRAEDLGATLIQVLAESSA